MIGKLLDKRMNELIINGKFHKIRNINGQKSFKKYI
jgi:hypothetical protein